MQPVEAQKGFSTKSQLFDSLKAYLNNKNRLQPIIGLGSIIECVKVDTHNREALYLCEVCMCRLSKADVRNHITGSFHRYNYIKARHLHLVSEWNENYDLSKLAWPLMEKAKVLEGKEGPGDVQLLAVEDALYQRMTTCSENDAITLINILRDGQGEPESYSATTSVQVEHYPIKSHRIVLLAENQERRSKKSIKTSTVTNKQPCMMQSSVAEGWSNNTSMCLWDNTQTSAETSVLSERSYSFLDGYTGTKPLIGLFHVVECRSEDGNTYCFLCHCCRVRSNKKDIIDHLTSSSHLRNCLMETHPEQVEVLMADDDNSQLLQSLVKKVEQEEGRGELKVVNAPESLCSLLTSKSYHWCMKMLCNKWTRTNIQKRKIAVKGPSVNQTSNQDKPEKCTVVLSERGKRRTTKKMRKASNTVFKVSLPLTKGSVLLERTSFSEDSLPVSSAYSPPSDRDLTPSPENCDLDFDTGSFAVHNAEHTSRCTTLQLQQDLCSGDANAGQYLELERKFVSHYQEVDGHFSNSEYFGHSEYPTGTKDPRGYGKKNYDRQHVSQEGSSKSCCKEWQNEGPQTPNEMMLHAVSHTQDWSSYNSCYRPEESCTKHWHNSTSQRKVAIRVNKSREERQKEMSSDATRYYYQQQPQNQHMARGYTSLLTGSVAQHGLSGEYASHSDAALINMHPYLADSLAPSSNIAPEPRAQFPQTEQRRWQTYMEFPFGQVQTAPQSYMTQPMAHQAIQVGHGVMSNPNYTTEPMIGPDQRTLQPSVLWSTQ